MCPITQGSNAELAYRIVSQGFLEGEKMSFVLPLQIQMASKDNWCGNPFPPQWKCFAHLQLIVYSILV